LQHRWDEALARPLDQTMAELVKDLLREEGSLAVVEGEGG
jgi:hypothetical protein